MTRKRLYRIRQLYRIGCKWPLADDAYRARALQAVGADTIDADDIRLASRLRPARPAHGIVAQVRMGWHTPALTAKLEQVHSEVPEMRP